MTEEMIPLPVAARYLRRNASRAMSGYIVRGLVELITNARDSAYRLVERGELHESQLVARPIVVDYFTKRGKERLVVRDRFEGMSSSIMEDRLLQYGGPASGFDNATVRGINARGAKDVGALGEVIFESIHNDRYSKCKVVEGRRSKAVMSASVDEATRTRLELSAGNGTVVTLRPFNDTTKPRFDALADDLERHVEIRYHPEGLPIIPIQLREVKDGKVRRDRPMEGFTPAGPLLADEEIKLPEFDAYSDGKKARLLLRRSEELLRLGGRSITRLWKSEAGALIVDGRTGHDIGFLGARGSNTPAAAHVFGELHLPHLPNLLLRYDEFERLRESDKNIQRDPLNPTQVTDPDRLGLNGEHPFVHAVHDAVRPLIEKLLGELQRRLTPPAEERVGAELRQALDKLGEKLAEKLDATDGLGPGRELRMGLTVIPGALRLEIGKAKRLGIYYRKDPVGEERVECQLVTTDGSLSVSRNAFELEPVPAQPGVFRGSVEVTGERLTDLATVEIRAGSAIHVLKVAVRDEIDGTIELDKDLQFSQRRYASIPGRNKQITIYADPSLDGATVHVIADHDDVLLSRSSVELRFDVGLGVAKGWIRATSNAETRTLLKAQSQHHTDEATIVFREIGGKSKINFEFEDTSHFGAPGRRFRWDASDSYLVKIAAKHPTLLRVLGPDLDPITGEKWPGQREPQARAIIAEIICEAFVARRVQDELPNLGVGPDNSVDPVDYDNFRYECLAECFELAHEALTPAYS